jgi:diguanylate cyclase (GGDEF)-like protein
MRHECAIASPWHILAGGAGERRKAVFGRKTFENLPTTVKLSDGSIRSQPVQPAQVPVSVLSTSRRALFLVSLLAVLAGPDDHALADGWDSLRTPIFVNLGRAQGLLHPVVKALAEDRDGFIWVGTQGGLSRYDGYRFRNFLHRENDPTSLPSNVISDLATDGGGRLWVASYSGDLARFDPVTDHFRNFSEPAGQRPRGAIAVMIGDGGNGVWVGTTAGLEHIDGETGQVIRFDHRADDPSSLPNNRISALARSRDGTLWIGTYEGLARLSPGRDNFVRIAISDSQGRAITDVISGLTEDSEGRIWFATAQSCIGRVDDNAVGHGLVNLSSPLQGGPMSTRILEGRPGELWVGRTSGGIAVVTMATGQARQIAHDPSVSVSLADNMVRGMLKDRSGQIWAATNLGVSLTNPANQAVDSVLTSTRPEGLADSNVISVAAGGDGRIWLGLKDHGLAILYPERGVITPLAKSDEILAGGVISLAVTPDGSVWLGGVSAQGLYRVTGTKIIRQRFPNENIGTIRTILPLAGRLWLGVGPLIDYDPASGAARIFRHDKQDDSLIDDSVGTMLPAGADRIWVGTRRGLELFSSETGQFRHFNHRTGDPESLPGDLVSCLLTDRRGRLWVGTLGSGLGVSDANGRLIFHSLSVTTGLPNDNIGALEEDDQGRIWASTADGLAVIDPDNFSVQALDLSDGVAIQAYWVSASAKLPDGSLLFGGGGGLTVVHPDKLERWRYQPPLVITAIRIDGQEQPAGWSDARPRLRLEPRQRSLSVEFAALDYSAPDKLHYAYRLEGFDSDWISTDAAHRSASYTNLPPGQYRLLLQGSNRDGILTGVLVLPLEVLPLWYQSWWFRVLMGALVVTGFASLLQVRTAILRRRSRHLEILVSRQTKDLTEANRRLAELASRDPLTEILNRRAFLEFAEHDIELARRSGRTVSLLMIDVDHFKRVNDSFGHGVGDEVLRSVVRHISALLRHGDLFARMGGEEFVVLLPDTERAAAMLAAERLRDAVESGNHNIPDGKVTVTVSIGLADGTPPESVQDLIDRADRALYAAKNNGRNRVTSAA